MTNPVLLRILEDVDSDIKESMLEPNGKYQNCDYLQDAALTALMWQLVRNAKKTNEPAG